MVPLLNERLEAVAADTVPQGIRDQLRARVRANAVRNQRLARELLQLLDVFDTAGISAVPFKGPTLAIEAYGDLALRSFGDLDILVPLHEVRRAVEILESLGYRPAGDVGVAHLPAFLRSDCEIRLIREDVGIAVEIHWAFAPRYFFFHLDPNRVRRRLGHMPLGGRKVKALTPEDLLVFLCLHGAKHVWERLGWVRDVAGLIRRRQSEIDWTAVARLARECGGHKALCLGLHLANDLSGAPLPALVRDEIRSTPSVGALAARITARLACRGVTPLRLAATIGFHLRLVDRPRDGIRYCVLLVATPTATDWESVSLPRGWAGLYFLIRPVRLSWKYTGAAARRVLRFSRGK